jgi:hypothetical protein
MFDNKKEIRILELRIGDLEKRLRQTEDMSVSMRNGKIKPVNPIGFDVGFFKVPTVILLKLIFDYLGLSVKYNQYGEWTLSHKRKGGKS